MAKPRVLPMRKHLPNIAPCLWFDGQAEEAARFYTGIFKRSRILSISHYTEAAAKRLERETGSVLAVYFELEGLEFTALNGGPLFKFSAAISLQVFCDTQREVDYFWKRLGQGGNPRARRCGWLKDKFGLSWQVVPRMLAEVLTDPDSEKAARAMKAMMGMGKLNIAQLMRAHAGRGRR